jgi:hypothetical protein
MTGGAPFALVHPGRGKIQRMIPALHSADLRYLSRMRQIVVTLILAIIFLVGIRLGIKWSEMSHKSGVQEENTVTVVQQIQSLSDLVTVKYVEEKVVILEDQQWYGANRVLLLAHGIVKAGIDLKKLSPGDVKISGKAIALRLPEAQIMDAYLDDRQTKVIDHTTGLFREFDKDLEQTARKTAVADLRLAARQNGIINDATERARLELAVFLHQAGYERIEFAGPILTKPVTPAR